MAQFKNKVIIVTGGAQGIGRAISLAFAQQEAKVLCADINVSAGKRLIEEAAALPGVVTFIESDVSQSSDCEAIVKSAIATWGGIDILCNNAGIQPLDAYVPAHELPEALWDRILNVNLKSCFLMSRYCVPVMKERQAGVIINVASVQGLQSAKGVAAYAASKGGILSLTRQLALEYADDGIRVLAVNPGTVDTQMADEATKLSDDSIEEQRAAWGRVHPMGRIAQPEEIANVVLFLAGDGASFMTGESVCVDGGVMAKGAWA